jgi:hypothetical protein
LTSPFSARVFKAAQAGFLAANPGGTDESADAYTLQLALEF